MADLSIIRPLRHENLQSAVYRQVCDLILRGSVEPGQSITVASLAEALDVSPMPVRDALSRLTHAGVLTTVSGRSLGVPHLSAATLEELYRVRVQIEGMAVEWAVPNRTKVLETTLRDLLAELVDAEERGDNKRFIDRNYHFHTTIYEHSGSATLSGIIQTLWLRVSPYFHRLDIQGHLHLSNERHEAVIGAIAAGDAAAARQALVDDIERAYEMLVKLEFAASTRRP